MLHVFELIIAIVYLILPGYLLARVLGLRSGWFVAFPFSVLLLVELVILFSVVNFQLRFIPILVVLTCFSVVCCWLILTKRTFAVESLPVDTADSQTRLLTRVCFGFAAFLALAVLYRSICYPLSGYDTFFRWEGLARQMLSHKSLSFYPPLTQQDFSIYLIPDGIPPLVASVYWWLYASIGQPVMQVTSVSVVLQLVSAMALTYYGACHAYGQRAAVFALAAFVSSAMLINGIAIGQEPVSRRSRSRGSSALRGRLFENQAAHILLQPLFLPL